MTDVKRKKRSRAGIIGYIHTLFSNVNKICKEYQESCLLEIVSLREIIEEKLSNVAKLSEEIQELIKDEAEFQEDFKKYTDIEVSLRQELAKLKNFIRGKQTLTTSKRESTEAEAVGKKSSRVKLP